MPGYAKVALDWVIVAWRSQDKFCLLASDQLERGAVEYEVEHERDWFGPLVSFEPVAYSYKISAETRRRWQSATDDPLVVFATGHSYEEALRKLMDFWHPNEGEQRGLPAAPLLQLTEPTEG